MLPVPQTTNRGIEPFRCFGLPGWRARLTWVPLDL